MERKLRCPRCNKQYIFLGVGVPTFCPECIIRDKEEYSAVRSYIRDNPGVDMYKVNEATKISVKKIMRYIREELIEVAPGSTSFLNCEMCGKIINTGYLCDECKKRYGDKVSRGLASTINLEGKMHTDSKRENK